MNENVMRRGREAREMLSDGHLFREIWLDLDAETVSRWRECADPETRERLHLKQAVLRDLELEAVGALEAAVRAEAAESGPEEYRPFKAFLDWWRKNNHQPKGF